jgi:para-aminobenzoate synthetase / 4-amino-4-deoxychorismate lyase
MGTVTDEELGRVAANVDLGITQDQYRTRILRIKEYISSGDTFQVNFTDDVSFPTLSAPDAIYRSLLRRQQVSYAALMRIDGCHIPSLSPELFSH